MLTDTGRDGDSVLDGLVSKTSGAAIGRDIRFQVNIHLLDPGQIAHRFAGRGFNLCTPGMGRRAEHQVEGDPRAVNADVTDSPELAQVLFQDWILDLSKDFQDGLWGEAVIYRHNCRPSTFLDRPWDGVLAGC